MQVALLSAVDCRAMEMQTVATKGLARAFKNFATDLEALPEDTFTKNFGPKTRTVADIVYEVNLVNDHIGHGLRSEEAFDWPEGDWIKAPVGFDTKEAVVNGFKKSSEKILQTVGAYTDSNLEEKVPNEGSETTKGERCRFMTLHLWYHSGQLNFIQTLVGDDGWHWE
jgi:hypothetical protein